MKKEEFNRLASKYAQGTTTKQEEEAMEHFFKQMQLTNKHLDFDFPAGQKLLDSILVKIGRPTPKKNKLWPKIASLAALLAVILGMSFFYTLALSSPQDTLVAQTQRGQRKEITLQDGSIITLNANSKITYQVGFSNKRQLILEGEAFFEVIPNPDKPFTVTTGNLKTQVLGTSFNIQAYNLENINVSVNSGKVALGSTSSKQSVVLEKNQQVKFSKGKFSPVGHKDAANFNAWKDNVIILDNTSLAQTAEILENWYDIEIEFAEDGISEQTISGKFMDEKLENVLASIAHIKHLNIEYITPNQILIREKPNKSK